MSINVHEESSSKWINDLDLQHSHKVAMRARVCSRCAALLSSRVCCCARLVLWRCGVV
jgi:hypothetical protein